MCVIASEGMDCDEMIRPMSMSMIGAGQLELSVTSTIGRVATVESLRVCSVCYYGKRAVIFVHALLGPFQHAVHHGT